MLSIHINKYYWHVLNYRDFRIPICYLWAHKHIRNNYLGKNAIFPMATIEWKGMIRMECLIPFYSTSTNLNVSAMFINIGSYILIAHKSRETDNRRDDVFEC